VTAAEFLGNPPKEWPRICYILSVIQQEVCERQRERGGGTRQENREQENTTCKDWAKGNQKSLLLQFSEV
jgi:hypothetical protein